MIVAGEIPSTIVHSDERIVAFRDLHPQAPVHVLVIPRDHYATLADAAASDRALVSDLMAGAAEVARAEGLADGYRLVINTGPDGGQTVDHVHVHLLGGRQMAWPPG